MKYLLSLTCLFVFLSGCQDSPTAAKAQVVATEVKTEGADTMPTTENKDPKIVNVLAHRNFVISSVDGQEFPAKDQRGQSRPLPNFDFGQWPQASGKICNNYTGQVELNNGILSMKNAATTMMMCHEDELNQLEAIFHRLLNEGVQMEFVGQTLTLKSPDHTLVFTVSDYVN